MARPSVPAPSGSRHRAAELVVSQRNIEMAQRHLIQAGRVVEQIAHGHNLLLWLVGALK
jgi:hypothetical protein